MSTHVNGSREGSAHEVDLLVVGSGGGGLVATLSALSRGHKPLLIEKTDLLGGSTALSGGQMWLPGNHYLTDQGVDDTPERGVAYLEDVVGDAGPGTSPARKRAFVTRGLDMLGFLEREGLTFLFSPSPDDYPEAEHGTTSGRAIEATLLKRSELGDWGALLRSDTLLPLPVHMHETLPATLALRSPRNFLKMCGLIARAVRMKVTREEYLTLGQALVGQLLIALKRRGAEVWRGAAMVELLVEDERVVGAVVERDGVRCDVRARHGVLLATGGYGRNAEMRRREQADPIDGSWSTTAPGDTGDGIIAAAGLGAQTVNLDEALWCPCPILDGKPMLGIWDRSLPHTIMVDQSGERYVNESLPYMELGQRMLARHQTVPAAPSWMVLDTTHRRRYPLVGAPPGITPRAWLKSGFVKKADTIEGLARECGIDPAALRRTVTRFNSFAVTGRDEDFGRGESSYDRFFADETHRPNPNLGALERGPFYAVQVFVADVATVGGVATDEHARVLREDGSVIEGLYSAGVGAASITGRIYPAPGASIANTMVFGYVAAEHALAGDREVVAA
jgi:3-oxosteroid 1-dehydrogenase